MSHTLRLAGLATVASFGVAVAAVLGFNRWLDKAIGGIRW